MKAFTVYQPYAHAIVAGVKHYETRPRRTHIRGRVAVHAGRLDEVPETLIDAASAVSGCGPAFVAMFIEGRTGSRRRRRKPAAGRSHRNR